MPNLKRLKFFDKDEIEWNDNPPKLEEFYQKLLSLKSTNKALHETGNINALPTEISDSVFAFLRYTNNSKVLIVLKLSK